MSCLHSFPTRRSSDLDRWSPGGGGWGGRLGSGCGGPWQRVPVDPAAPGRRSDRAAGEARPPAVRAAADAALERSEEHTSELQSPCKLLCSLLLEKQKM